MSGPLSFCLLNFSIFRDHSFDYLLCEELHRFALYFVAWFWTLWLKSEAVFSDWKVLSWVAECWGRAEGRLQSFNFERDWTLSFIYLQYYKGLIFEPVNKRLHINSSCAWSSYYLGNLTTSPLMAFSYRAAVYISRAPSYFLWEAYMAPCRLYLTHSSPFSYAGGRLAIKSSLY